MKRIKGIAGVGLVVIIVLVTSCRTSKVITSDGLVLTGDAQLEAIIHNTPVFDSFSSRLRLTLPVKGEVKNINGTLKIKRDELIQISLVVPVVRTEAARIEISPQRVVILDRVNRCYVSVPVSELQKVFHTEVDYPMLQALFSNQVFLSGKPVLSKKDLASFDIRQRAGEGVVLSKKTRESFLSFFASNTMNRLTESTLESRPRGYRMQWKYDSFVPVGNITFPTEMTVSIGNGKETGRGAMELSRLSVDKVSITPVTIPSRYQEVSLDALLNMLLNV